MSNLIVFSISISNKKEVEEIFNSYYLNMIKYYKTIVEEGAEKHGKSFVSLANFYLEKESNSIKGFIKQTFSPRYTKDKIYCTVSHHSYHLFDKFDKFEARDIDGYGIEGLSQEMIQYIFNPYQLEKE